MRRVGSRDRSRDVNIQVDCSAVIVGGGGGFDAVDVEADGSAVGRGDREWIGLVAVLA